MLLKVIFDILKIGGVIVVTLLLMCFALAGMCKSGSMRFAEDGVDYGEPPDPGEPD